ncbi:IBR finger domain protein [Aspergillus crustosus]
MPSKRTVLITGCSDGSLGSVLALHFHKAGWRVFASARNLSKLSRAKEAGIEIVTLDTLSDDSIRKCVSEIEELTGGSLDALINNAGGGYSMPLMDLDIPRARELFDLNVWSIVSVTQAFLRLLLKSQHGGLVVNNTSCSSISAGTVPFAGAYNASKAAASGLTETLRLELEPFGIKVVNLMTGSVRSTFHHNAPTVALPPTSIYNVAKEIVEKEMAGGESGKGSDPDEWASHVVRDLSKRNPSHWVWKGQYSTLAWLGSLLPVGFFDGTMKKMVGLDILERKYKEQQSAK